MRTNIDIDDVLLKQAMEVSKAEAKTKRAVVEEALRLLVRIRAQETLRDLFGKGEFIDGYDYKAMRGDSSEGTSREVKSSVGRTRRTANSSRGTRKRAA